MADFWSQTPNFTHPDYASPEQLAQQRRYAEELQKQSGQDVNRPTGALANIINALTAGLTRNNANQIQSQGAAQNAQAYAEALRQARGPGGWQGVNPDLIGQLGAAPLGSPEQRSFVQHLIQPQTIESPYKEPASMAPATGVQAPRLPPNYQPGAPFSQAVQGNSQSGVAPPPQTMPMTPTNPQGGMYGGLNFRPAPAPPPGSGGPGADVGLPPASPPVGPNGAPTRRMSMDELRDYGIKSTFLQEQGKAQTGTMTGDVEAANTAPTRMRLLGTMREEMLSHPEITTGPTAEISNNIKRAISNYAPGMLGDKQMEGLAAADSIGKLSTQLASMGAGAGRSDMGLMAGMNSVPHQQNSRQGFIALTEMGIAVENQNLQMRRDLAGIKDPAQYEQARHQWFAQHPIINPLSGNPIIQDLEEQKRASASGNASNGPPIGTISGGYKFKGGNVKDKANWEKIP